MKLEDAIIRVKKASATLQRIEGAVRKRLEPRAAQGRQIPIVFTQSFVFTPTVVRDVEGVVQRVTLPMNLVQLPIVNGAEDCLLKEVSYTATFADLRRVQFSPISTEEAVDFPNVLGTTLFKRLNSFGPFAQLQPAFDFQWNAQLMSTQANYLSQANNAQFLSRRSLGHVSRGVRRQLYSNLLFRAGDALLVSVQPTCWGLPIQNFGFIQNSIAPHAPVQLTISFFGTRGPDMVELAEDDSLDP